MTTYSAPSPIALNSPDGLCLDSSSNVYVVDSGNNRVLKFANGGGTGQVLITNTTANSSPALSYPWNCAVDSAGNLYVSNTVGAAVNVFSSSTGAPVKTITAAPTPFIDPNQIALDSAGNLYVADSNNYRVVKFNSAGAIQATVFNLGTGSYPNGVAVDSAGTVYVTATSNNVVVVFNAAGNNIYNLTTSNPSFNGPRGVWVDSSMNVFVADSGNSRIVKFSTSGGNGCNLGTNTVSVGGYNAVSIYTTGTRLSAPFDVVLDSTANMYGAYLTTRTPHIQTSQSDHDSSTTFTHSLCLALYLWLSQVHCR